MSNYLLYWKYFWEDIADNPSAFNELWHTRQEGFWNKVKSGDSLWVVISGGSQFPDEWRLLQRIVVQEKFTNFSFERPYGIIGNEKTGQHYDVSTQFDLTPLLHKLEFLSGKKITANGRAIGNAIQAIRPLSENDGLLLNEYAQKLNRHPSDVGFVENISQQFEEDSTLQSNLTGAGFGNPETNQKVERAAVSLVTEWYESKSWTVKSVELEKCGYDLLCQKDSEENHVEVKGIQGKIVSFIITRREVMRAQSDPDFVLCVVTSALSSSPKLNIYDRESFANDFDLMPLSYQAKLRK